jgi:hypothetical protein
VLGSSKWPSGFKLYYSAGAKYYIEKNAYPPPTVWRYLRRSDLTNYYNAIRRYRMLVDHRITDHAARQALRFGLPWHAEQESRFESRFKEYEHRDRVVLLPRNSYTMAKPFEWTYAGKP